MHIWVEDQNLIKMMKKAAEQNNEVEEALGNDLLNDVDSSSINIVHIRAEGFREWMKSHNDVLLNIQRLNLENTGLTSLPEEIDLFPNLQVLNLSKNQLCSSDALVIL
jgi:Leucine-rich repeat (LRR) protein